MKYRTGQIVVTITTLIAALSLTCHASISSPGSPPPGDDLSQIDQVAIKRIAPERAGGQGYQLVYRVKLPIALYWEFKTDFDNSFLIENKFIRAHRFISQAGNVAITENKYKHGPDVFFRWRTTLSPETFRLDFILLNPGQCHQKYHYGYIQLKSEGEYTRVIQVAYFDFWGASFWAHYPWQGGMKDFLTYTARWEQATALRFGNRYRDANDPKE